MVKNPLRKRYLRDLKSDLGKYLVIFLLLVFSIAEISGFLVAAESMLAAYYESFEKYNVEDGNFTVGKKLTQRLPDIVNRVCTFLLVMIGWVLFYYPTLGQAFRHLWAMLPFTGPFLDAAARDVIRSYSVLPLIFFALSLPLGKWFTALGRRLRLQPAFVNGLMAALMLVVCALSVLFIEGLSSNPFIYFQF